MRARSLCWLAAMLAAACRPAPPEQLALSVEYSGCRDVIAGACATLPAAQLTVWVRAPIGAQVEVDAGPQADAPPPVEVQGGARYDVKVHPDARALIVKAHTASAASTWRLPLRTEPAAEVLTAARAAIDGGDLESGRTMLERDIDKLPDTARTVAIGLLARIALREGRREDAQAQLRASIAAARAHSQRLVLARDAATLVYLLTKDRHFSEARSLLDELNPQPEDPAENRYLLDYQRGLLALDTGDARDALHGFEAAVEQAERVGLTEWQRAAQDQLATQLQYVGRRGEADAIFARLLREAPADLDDCARAQLLTNAGWNRLSAFEAGEPAEDPTPMLAEALTLYERGCAAQVERIVNARLNLALAALHAGRTDDAATALAAVAPVRVGTSANILLWSRDLEGRVALAQQRPRDALAAYAELATLADASAAPEAQWRAAVGRAQSLVALDSRSDALEAFARAEHLLDEESMQVPMQEGRETFMARREGATREYVALLLAAQRPDAALDVVRNARSRSLRALYRQDRLAHLSGPERARWDKAIGAYLEQRDALNAAAAQDWQRSTAALGALETERAATRASLARALDEAFLVLDRNDVPLQLQRPAQGELVLAYHPLPKGWAAFAYTSAGTREVTLECVDAVEGPPALAGCLLEPFHAEIEAAQRIRVLPYGVLRGVDFHALPFAGDVLLAAAPVVYGLDLPAVESTAERTGRALVVADPRGNLPAARREAERVTSVLAAGREWAPEKLEGRDAFASALRDRLGEVDLFHYAGHAVFGGIGGWESVLPLAESSDLSLGDILALAHAPRWVVLSGCETGRTDNAAPAESLGLAQAFLAAGSTSVLAAVRPVADGTAAAIIEDYYRAWSATTSPSAALRTAQLALRVRDPRADWSSFRIVEH
jgi:tetratricopeptide (TPR) repeat protein